MQNAAKRLQINAERSKTTKIIAQRNKTARNSSRTQQNDTKLMQNAHSLENELML